ncbi:MAG: lamin tail domain-containing protein [Geodermatophilaceae bacterium]
MSPDVVISEVYGGGGSSGATLKQDFIELYNRGASEASVEGWSVQYASSSGTHVASHRTDRCDSCGPELPRRRRSGWHNRRRPGGDATTPVEVIEVTRRTALSISPGRIEPNHPAWENSRKPLAGEFTYRGQTLFIVANRFNSKGGDDALFGANQPPVRSSEDQRHQQSRTRPLLRRRIAGQ